MRLLNLATACVALICVTGFDPAVAQSRLSNDVVKIGVLTDMSGVFSDLAGRGSLLAAQMAIDDFKAQAKPSFQIELISADHQNKPDIGAAKAREWYDVEHVDMITDAINSAVALAVSKVTQDKGKVLLVTGSGTTRLTNEECSPNTVSYTWDTYAMSHAQVREITKGGKDTWFVIAVDYALGQSLENELTSALLAAGGRKVGSVRHPLNTSDFSSYLLQAQASKAKVIALANAGGDLANAVKTAREFGIDAGGQTVVGLVPTITDVNAMGLDNAQKLQLLEGFYWDLNEATRAWSKRFYAVHKAMPNFVQAGTYSAVFNYLQAVQAIGTDDAASVMRRMKSTPINDMFAKGGRIRQDGRMVHDMYMVEVKKPSESKAPWDYYHIRKVIPGEEAYQPLAESRCKLLK